MPNSWKKHQVVQRYDDIGVHLLQVIMGYHIRVHEVSASNAPIIDVDASHFYRKQQQHLPSATCTDISL